MTYVNCSVNVFGQVIGHILNTGSIDMKPKLYFPERKAWRAWLQEHHVEDGHVWLVFFKKGTGVASMDYVEGLEEALCFGWIDGLKKRIDEQRYAYRFTPRKKASKWSPTNIRLAQKMIAQGKMTQAGLTVFENRIPYDEGFLKAKAGGTDLPVEIMNRLKANKTAWKNFTELSPGYKKQYVAWLTSAKKEETTRRRTEKAIRLLEENKKPGM